MSTMLRRACFTRAHSFTGCPDITVRKLQLHSADRPALIDRKGETLDKARALLGLVAAAGADPILQALREDEVDRMCALDAEFSAMARTYIEGIRQHTTAPATTAPAASE
jgi:predicted  nucleic acid-binding Zn-ribbon protein